jgi:hypothetical protein
MQVLADLREKLAPFPASRRERKQGTSAAVASQDQLRAELSAMLDERILEVLDLVGEVANATEGAFERINTKLEKLERLLSDRRAPPAPPVAPLRAVNH